MKNYEQSAQFTFYGMLAVILIVLTIAFPKVMLTSLGIVIILSAVFILISWWNNSKLERMNRHYEKKNKKTYDRYRRGL